ncbi:MAG: hypothetical protein ACFE7R_06230, partial [Candidatus Hodarchaeota archaeon]
MNIVGVAGDVELYAPEDSYLSFFNSPYVGHQRFSSVDIYPSHGEWLGPCVTPCGGIVSEIRRSKMGRHREFKTEDFDYSIGIRPDSDETKVVRIMHCVPSVSIGNRVDTGDLVGNLIRSRYFNYWTGPHYHVDVMSSEHFLRSTMSFPFEINVEELRVIKSAGDSELDAVVVEAESDRLVVVPNDTTFGRSGNLYGHLTSGELDGWVGMIDAGIPHYSHGGLFGVSAQKTGCSVSVWGQEIGVGDSIRHRIAQYTRTKRISIEVDKKPLLGISCYLYTKHQLQRGNPPLVLIPREYNGLI